MVPMMCVQVLAQAIRPLVWEKGLWSTELEKAWTHLFDIVACLMKLGYPQEYLVCGLPSGPGTAGLTPGVPGMWATLGSTRYSWATPRSTRFVGYPNGTKCS